MITYGFAAGLCDLATIDTNFPKPSAYLYVSGDTGDIVFENTNGNAQYFPNAQTLNLYPLAARKILSSGTVNGTPRTTTATGICYLSTGIP